MSAGRIFKTENTACKIILKIQLLEFTGVNRTFAEIRVFIIHCIQKEDHFLLD